MMRMQFVPLPRMNPRQPSSRPIFTSAFQVDILYSFRPTLWIWRRIFNRSRGDTIVLDTAPATPPAINAATTGSARLLFVRLKNVEGLPTVSWLMVMVSRVLPGIVRHSHLDCVGRKLRHILQARFRCILQLLLRRSILSIQAHCEKLRIRCRKLWW